MKIRKHGNLVDKEMAGNGYHGCCEHCGLALVTDLGYNSWEDSECIEREITNYLDIPKDLREYASWIGLKWDNTKKIYTKPYSEQTYTLGEFFTTPFTSIFH